ncbi:MAG: hypothetical protein RBR14_00420 [Candidatus Cloacimonas acidaminovorans]|nr:hypothetical protein [Candidatus Cloacimonas acidaminovorans]
MPSHLYIIIGAYGSGKSEYSIHLARRFKTQGLDVVLADLDVVNPYFRSREMQDDFIQEGIDIIAPEGEYKHSDLPMISPRVKGAIQNKAKTVILDVGGDPAGCRTLGRFEEPIKTRGYNMLYIVNTMRPFTSTPEEIISMKEALEATSRLKITEIICNTNLMDETTAEIVLKGIKIVEKAAELSGLPFKTYLVLNKYEKIVPDKLGGKKREVMAYNLKKPWELFVAKGIC